MCPRMCQLGKESPLSVPSMLVKANSHGSSYSKSGCNDRSHLSSNSAEGAGMDAIVTEEGVGVLSLESPPCTRARTIDPREAMSTA